jgi:hypothetical protein
MMLGMHRIVFMPRHSSEGTKDAQGEGDTGVIMANI